MALYLVAAEPGQIDRKLRDTTFEIAERVLEQFHLSISGMSSLTLVGFLCTQKIRKAVGGFLMLEIRLANL